MFFLSLWLSIKIIYLPRKNTLNGRFYPHHVRGPNPIPLSLWLLVPTTVSHLAGRRNGLGSEQVEAADGRKLPYLVPLSWKNLVGMDRIWACLELFQASTEKDLYSNTMKSMEILVFHMLSAAMEEYFARNDDDLTRKHRGFRLARNGDLPWIWPTNIGH